MTTKRPSAKKRKTGRPALPEAEVRDEILDIRLSTLELQLVKTAARLEGLADRVYGRRILLLSARDRIQQAGLPVPTKVT